MPPKVFAIAACAMLLTPAVVRAVPVQYDLSFETTGQSIWNTGTSFTLNQRSFIGAAWRDQTTGIDGIIGEGQTVPNPLRITYDAAFAACRALGFSSSSCINGQSFRAPVPALGSRPSVRSCGRFAVGCQLARAGDVARRAAYDVAFAACRGLGFSATVCRNGQSGRAFVPALGTAPPATLSAATGVAVEGTTDGRVGLELGIEIDSGSVDAMVSYEAILDIPDTTGLASGATINFNPESVLAGTNTLDASFANLGLSVDAIMELSGSVSAETCLIALGCTSGGTPFNIDETAPILSFNEDGEGGILLLGQSPSVFGLPAEADGFPFTLDVAGLAAVTLHLPQPNATGGLDPSGQTLSATGQDDLVDLFLDVDNVIATAAGVPGLFGSSLSFGPFSAGFDIIDVQMGPTIDLQQDFELDPTLFVQLLFDQAVMIGGMLVTEFTSAWDLLPDITFLADDTTVSPTFFLDATLMNETLLDFDLEFIIDLLQITYGFDPLGIDDSIGIGNVLDRAIDLFDSPNLFSNLFELQGFNLQIGESFVISLGSASNVPTVLGARSAVNPIVVGGSVPEPGMVLLILTGMFGFFALRRRDRPGRLVLGGSGARPSTMA